MMGEKRIYDVDVNRSAIKKSSSLDEFKKLNPHIFDHLGDKEASAYAELWAEYNPAPVAKATTGTGDALVP